MKLYLTAIWKWNWDFAAYKNVEYKNAACKIAAYKKVAYMNAAYKIAAYKNVA